MGGESAYGRSLGFGTRNGFVEHYWYKAPSTLYGQLHSHGEVIDQYLRVDEEAPLLQGGLLLGEENEEYEAQWSSDWRTFEPAERGGAYNPNAPPQGHAARFGPLRSFPYRYFMSSLRLLQMRVNYLLASTVVVSPDLYAYVAASLGHEADTSADAWCLMASAEFDYGRGTVSNFERWLYQRDEPATVPGGVRTFPDARLTQTPAFFHNGSWSTTTWMTAVPHDWIAHTAPRGVIGFRLDPAFTAAAASPLASRVAVVKVTFFDVREGTLALTQAHRTQVHDDVDTSRAGVDCWLECDRTAGACPSVCGSGGACCKRGVDTPTPECGLGTRGCTEHHCCTPPPTGQLWSLGSIATSGDGTLKTVSFVASPLAVRGGASTALFPFDFEVRATSTSGEAHPLVLSMVRVVKTDELWNGGAPSPSTAPPLAVLIGTSLVAIAFVLMCAVAGTLAYCKLRKHAKWRVERRVDPSLRSATATEGRHSQSVSQEAGGTGAASKGPAAATTAFVVQWSYGESSASPTAPADPPKKNPFFL